jgi:hypothetical protein
MSYETNEKLEDVLFNQAYIIGENNFIKIMTNKLNLTLDSGDLDILDDFFQIIQKRDICEKVYVVFFKIYNNLKLNNIKIKIDKSPIDRLGVFSTKTIYKNEIITFYPAHALKFDHLTITNPIIYDSNNIDKTIFDGGEHNYENALGVNLFGDKNKYDNLNMVGHMINDPCSSQTIEEIQRSNNTYKNLLKYGLECCTKKMQILKHIIILLL